jgi:hypothetical protein
MHIRSYKNICKRNRSLQLSGIKKMNVSNERQHKEEFKSICKAATDPTQVEVRHAGKNEIAITVHLDRIPEGWTAAYCRSVGLNIPDNIPDCAIAGPGGKVFEWINLDLTATPRCE